jgi:DNA end-binding protein Ku
MRLAILNGYAVVDRRNSVHRFPFGITVLIGKGFPMAGRAIWKGQIHCGVVDIPVKLHTSVREEHIHFHLLHRRDLVRLKQEMVCAYEKVPVPAEEQTKGYKLEDEKYLLVDPEELERTEPEASRTIEVHEFVKSAEIDPMFVSRGYYLEPDTESRGYAALAAALAELDVEGVCSWTMRKRSYVGALQAKGKILRLNTLRYADEVIAAQTLDLQDVSLSERELQIGLDLIDRLTVAFEPRKFENEHQKKLQALIDKKARGEKIVHLRPRRVKPTKSDNLLHVLQESLKKVA